MRLVAGIDCGSGFTKAVAGGAERVSQLLHFRQGAGQRAASTWKKPRKPRYRRP